MVLETGHVLKIGSKNDSGIKSDGTGRRMEEEDNSARCMGGQPLHMREGGLMKDGK